MHSANLTVLIVSWNNWPKLRACLSSIYGGSVSPTEIIVIDNHSTDGTIERLVQTFPSVKLYECPTNLGHTKAVNLGLSLALGELILILDNDTELAPDCIEILLAFMNARSAVMMVAPRTFNSDGTVQESARNLPGILSGLFGRQSFLTRMFPTNPIARRYLAREFIKAREPFQVEQIGGACMMFRRSLLRHVGPWDARYAGYWVDTDWCKSLCARGLAIFCVPDAHLVHHESNARHKRKTPSRIWMFHKGAYQYYTKWHTSGILDPRSVFAWLLLSGRALLQIAMNELRPLNAIPSQREDAEAPSTEVHATEL